MTTVRIPSKLYYDLWKSGNEIAGISGDGLIAVYSTLKAFKHSEIKYYAYTAKNNKKVGGYSLLRKQTNLSLSVLKKYVPVLIEMGLCFFDTNGDFVLLGGEKTKQKYNSYKLIPITLGNNLIETRYNCFSIRIESSKRQQLRMIEKKKHRSVLLLQSQNPYNLKQLKAGRKYKAEDLIITDKAVLSNQGFAALKDNSINNKAKGHYYKRRLREKGIIQSSRRYELLEKMSYNDYKICKLHGNLPRNYTYIRGRMAKELVATVSVTDLVNQKKETGNYVDPTAKTTPAYKKKEYLQFDMIDFWVNGMQ